MEKAFDGSCAACVGARRIYCLDGSGDPTGSPENLYNYLYGSCQPNYSYCTDGGRNEDVIALMNYRECEYTPVQSPATSSSFETDMIELTITEEMARTVASGEKLTLLDFMFKPSQWQMVKVTNAQSVLDAGLYFDGVFDVHKHEAIEDDPRIVNQIDLNVLKVYFTNREPTRLWGYPTQMDDLYEDIVTPLSSYDNPFYVTIANPSTYYYQLQMRLEPV